MNQTVAVLLSLSLAGVALAEEQPHDAVHLEVIDHWLASARGDVPRVLSNRPYGGDPAVMERFLSRTWGDVITDELGAVYRRENRESAEIKGATLGSVTLMDLREFETAAGYDWARLQEELPGLEEVFRLSATAYDRTGTLAVVRFDVIREDPITSWTHLISFKRRSDGSWEGGLMSVLPYPPESYLPHRKARDANGITNAGR